MARDEWRQAIAAVVDADDVIRGTAFFVGTDAALTCQHVLSAARGGRVRLRPVDSQIDLDVESHDSFEEQDLVLLRVGPGTAPRPLTLRDERAEPGDDVGSFGFPYTKLKEHPDGYPLSSAKVSGSTKVQWQNNLIPVLIVAGVEADQGMSGAPLVDLHRGDVVGILRLSNLKDRTAHAVPAEMATERWPGLRSAAPQSFEELIGSPDWLAWTKWAEFDPARFHCVVVDAERAVAEGSAPANRLSTLVDDLFARKDARRLWAAFTAAWRGRRLVPDRAERRLPQNYERKAVSISKLSVVDAFASRSALEAATRMLVEADLVVMDVTGFEPGVMLLLGVRASTRRGVTVASHGGGWHEGDPLDRPFNLSDLSLASHTRPPGPPVGQDARIARLADRVSTGFDQLAHQPHYLDLPVYDALRQLGTHDNASASIPVSDEVLVLCSYGKEYFARWEELNRQVSQALSQQDHITNVTRLLDRATPQLVSQSLYERIRRCSGCIGDWTFASPSTFFELGVRIAVSPWSVVQVVDDAWFKEHSDEGSAIAKQLKAMRAIFNPLGYRDLVAGESDLGRRVVDELLAAREQFQGRGGHRVRQVVAQALGRVAESLPGPVEQLRDDADALNRRGRLRSNVPQALFYEVSEIKADQEVAARERRIAAWLYLEHRLRATGRLDDEELWFDLGEAVATDLLASDVRSDVETGLDIGERLRGEWSDLGSLERSVALQRNRGDALLKLERGKEAAAAYELGLADASKALELLGVPIELAAPPASFDEPTAIDAAEWLGVQGGLLHRLSAVSDDRSTARRAVESYIKGAAFESAFDLPQTYNRTNAIKRSLVVGLRTMAQVTGDLRDLRSALERRLATDERASDDAWVWADLGDTCLLLGDRATAVSAYQTFATKARSDSPDSTLAVLRQVAESLAASQDPEADRIERTIIDVAALLRPDSAGEGR